MAILNDRRRRVKSIDARATDTTDHAPRFVPTREDLAGAAAWYAEQGDPGHVDEPTPVEVLDFDRGTLPWWATLPTDPELDTPIGLGPEAPCFDCDDAGFVAGSDGRLAPCPRCNAPLPQTDLDIDPVTAAAAAAALRWLEEGRGLRGRASSRLRDDDQDHYRHLFRG